jgi:hypothetical protein
MFESSRERQLFVDIYEYITRPKMDRQAHLALGDACICIGGTSQEFKGALAYYLGTTIPHGMKIHLCHACHNSKCSNPQHLYWGTPRENHLDAIADGKQPPLKVRLAPKLDASNAKGSVWATNGEIDIRVRKNEMPDGFRRGRTKQVAAAKCQATGRFLAVSQLDREAAS